MSIGREFREFALKGNVIDLAVAVVVGTAFTKIVNALVTDLIMPLITVLLPNGDWRSWKLEPPGILYGDLLGAIVDFVLVAFVLFIIVVKIGRRIGISRPAAEVKQ